MNPISVGIQMPDDVDSQYDCPSSSSSFSSGGPLTPSHSFSDFSPRPSTALSSNWAPWLSAHSSSFSLQHSAGPSTPPNEQTYYPMDTFLPNAPYSFPTQEGNASIFTEEASIDLCDENLVMASWPMNFPNKHLATWELAAFGEGSVGTLFMEAHGESSMDMQDQMDFAPATGLDAFFSWPMFERTQTEPEIISFPHARQGVELSNSLSPQTIAPSQTFARPSTPVSGVADAFHTPVHTPSFHTTVDTSVRTPTYTSVKSEASEASVWNEPFPMYSPCTSPSVERSPASYFFQTPRVWERPFTPTVLDYGCKTPSLTRTTKKGSRHASQSIIDRSPFIVSKGDKIHKCHYPGCDGAFKRQEHLKRHQKKHAKDEKPFQCEVSVCKKRFDRTDNLKAHYYTHLDKEDGGRRGKGARNRRLSREQARELGRKYNIKIFQIPLSEQERRKRQR
ncbi:MAG: hypothetical protein FRX48_09659 [Lasallia pustulata]|uniref:C2H2 type master regulator of conidiophore development brlA n=1 Tax=Lasallia pustulata TaxID=136370 RepID=A0A5M8PCD8_9LECA|nr:MAG: hypothetical protein FRX48_09659 [Lasallia pustulata]